MNNTTPRTCQISLEEYDNYQKLIRELVEQGKIAVEASHNTSIFFKNVTYHTKDELVNRLASEKACLTLEKHELQYNVSELKSTMSELEKSIGNLLELNQKLKNKSIIQFIWYKLFKK